jgi:hypothetical protein
MASVPVVDYPNTLEIHISVGIARAKWQVVHHEPLSPRVILIADPLEPSTCQKAGFDRALPNLLCHERGNLIDVVLINKASTCVDLQPGETVVLGEAKL